MSIKLRGGTVHRIKLAATQDNNTMTGTLTFAQITAFTAKLLPVTQQPNTMAATLQFVSASSLAWVTAFDPSGNIIGNGPAADPQGAFVGYPNTQAAEFWHITSHPVGVIITPLAGGRFKWDAGVAGQSYTFQGQITGGVTTNFSKTYTPTVNGAGDSALFAPYLRHAFPDFNSPIGVALSINAAYYIPGATTPGQTVPQAATYTMTAWPGMSINASTGMITGSPTVATNNVQVTCTNPLGSLSDTFNYTVPVAPVAGVLIVTATEGTDNSTLNFTTLTGGAGNLTYVDDWVHLGVPNPTSLNRKANVYPRIGPITDLGNPPLASSGPVLSPLWQFVRWGDGTPVPGQGPLQGGVYWEPTGSGFKMIVQAGVASKTLHLLMGGSNANHTITVSLSDGSAPAYSLTQNYWEAPAVTPKLHDAWYMKLDVTFQATSENQVLVIQDIVTKGDNVSVAGAYLVSTGTQEAPPQIETVGDKWVVANTQLQFTVKATDFEGHVVSIAIVGTPPAGSTLIDNGNSSATFTWTPSVAGDTVITFKATEPNLQFATETITVHTQAVATPQPSVPLRKYPANPRWFEYDGQPIHLVGGDSSSLGAWNTNFDYKRVLEVYKTYGIGKLRLWVDAYWDPAGMMHPWKYTGDNLTGFYDLDVWNDAYWIRYRDVIEYARTLGIMVEISIFSGYYASTSFWTDTTVRTVWNKAFNNNNVFTTNPQTGHFSPGFFNRLAPGGETSTVKPGGIGGHDLFYYQRALVDKCILEFGGFPNVYFEIMNEPYGSSLSAANDATIGAWLNFMANYLKTQTSRLVSATIEKGQTITSAVGSIVWDNPNIDILDAHITSKQNGAATVSSNLNQVQLKNKILSQNEGSIGSNYYFNFVIEGHNQETPHTVNYPQLEYITKEMWGWFLSGGHYNVYEAQWPNIPGWVNAVGKRTKALHDIVATLNFATLQPIDVTGSVLGGAPGAELDALIVNGPGGANRQLIATPGVQYLAYFWGTPAATACSITLGGTSSTVFTYRWYDPRDGSLLLTGTVNGGGLASVPAPSITAWSGGSGLVLTIKVG